MAAGRRTCGKCIDARGASLLARNLMGAHHGNRNHTAGWPFPGAQPALSTRAPRGERPPAFGHHLGPAGAVGGRIGGGRECPRFGS